MIERILVLSTAHIPDDPEVYYAANLGFERAQPRVIHHSYGWIVFLADAPMDCPDWFKPIQDYAIKNCCDYVNFDHDVEAIDDLPTWEW